MTQGISRRNFLSGAALAAGAAAVAGLSGCSPKTMAETGPDAAATAGGTDSGMAVVGNTPAWLGTAPEIAEADIVETRSTKLLIVGAGNAGLAAAVTAQELGVDFLIAEKAGAVATARGWYGAVNIPECAEAGKSVDIIKLNNVLRQAF